MISTNQILIFVFLITILNYVHPRVIFKNDSKYTLKLEYIYERGFYGKHTTTIGPLKPGEEKTSEADWCTDNKTEFTLWGPNVKPHDPRPPLLKQRRPAELQKVVSRITTHAGIGNKTVTASYDLSNEQFVMNVNTHPWCD